MLILGSTSPRRKEILSFFKIPFNIITPDFDEESIPYAKDPYTYVKKIAEGKALSIQKKELGLPILTADTIVVLENELFLKPNNHQKAFEMLSKLSGKTHTVLTAVCLLSEERTSTLVVETKVTFHPYDQEQINRYIESINVLDKSGSYAIQGIGSLIVKSIDGCFYNVMGLPLHATFTLLEKFGFNLWEYLKT